MTPATPRPEQPDTGLPRTSRLRTGREHSLVRTSGRHHHGTFLRLGVAESGDSRTRAASVVSRRVGSAVIRNRVKRRLREIYRHQRRFLREGLLLVVTAKPAAATASSSDLLAEWLRLGKRLSIFGDS